MRLSEFREFFVGQPVIICGWHCSQKSERQPGGSFGQIGTIEEIWANDPKHFRVLMDNGSIMSANQMLFEGRNVNLIVRYGYSKRRYYYHTNSVRPIPFIFIKENNDKIIGKVSVSEHEFELRYRNVG